MSSNLTLEQFQAVRRMLRERKRYVEIARTLDLSLWTVTRIAVEPQFQRDDLTEAELPEDDAPADFVSSELRRCTGCGAMVYRWPCLGCQMAESPRLADAVEEDGDDEEEGDELFELLEEAARS
jgi:hypothetical protein